jgi:polyphosphate glucokinase
MSGQAFGVDIGGSGIKGAVVDLDTGKLSAERYKLPTPLPSYPPAVAAAVAAVVAQFGWSGPIGCTFPAVVKAGVAYSAAHVDPAWVGTNVEAIIEAATGLPVTALNDADAAGVAEATFGAAVGQAGLVVVTTLGTGIGTALLHHGELIPNSELGHLEIDGVDAELRASAAARDLRGLSWDRWAKHLQRYFQTLEALLWPDLIVVGGGVSRRADRFLPLISLRTPIVAAALRNEAGIIGAGLVAASRFY